MLMQPHEWLNRQQDPSLLRLRPLCAARSHATQPSATLPRLALSSGQTPLSIVLSKRGDGVMPLQLPL